MRNRIVLLPGALEREGEIPLSEVLSPTFSSLVSQSSLSRVSASTTGVPEADWLGFGPINIASGVLSVAAFGADPPDRSVHFHLSVLSLTDGRISPIPYQPTSKEQELLMAVARRLETPRLTVVEGRGLDHGLVWEDGSIELETATPEQAIERGLAAALPNGDGEPMLRRFIDDSVNLLGDLELNRIRQEEGLLPMTMLWPWGAGFRPRMANLSLERGAMTNIESPSIRFRGLARLAGYRHGDPWSIGSGTNIRLESIELTLGEAVRGLAVLPAIGEFRVANRLEELTWFGRELSQRLLDPLMTRTEAEPSKLTLVATDACGEGLALQYSPRVFATEQMRPFSAETIQEKAIPSVPFAEFMAKELSA